MEDDQDLPGGVCRLCSESGLAAYIFRQACRVSYSQWSQAAEYLSTIQHPNDFDKTYYIFYGAQTRTVIGDQTVSANSKAKALERVNSEFQDPIEFPERPKRIVRKMRRDRLACPDCGKKFSMATFLNAHLRNTLKRACTECGLVMPKAKLVDHLSRAHGKNSFSCGICHHLFEDLQDLTAHLAVNHNESKFHCEVCGGSFNNERALSAHQFSHSLFHCNACGKCYENRKCFMYHQKICNMAPVKSVTDRSSNQYDCDYCGSTYTKKPSLRVHIIQKHLNVLPYVCETCGKRTSTISHMRSHEQTHKLQRRLFQCYCGAKMRTELGFHLHQRIHSGEKPYECEECGDKFLSASRRLDHIKRRHRSAKDMPHGCSECTARFVRPFELKKHYMSVHSRMQVAQEIVIEPQIT